MFHMSRPIQVYSTYSIKCTNCDTMLQFGREKKNTFFNIKKEKVTVTLHFNIFRYRL